jgi:hypothetical protein
MAAGGRSRWAFQVASPQPLGPADVAAQHSAQQVDPAQDLRRPGQDGAAGLDPTGDQIRQRDRNSRCASTASACSIR